MVFYLLILASIYNITIFLNKYIYNIILCRINNLEPFLFIIAVISDGVRFDG